MPKALVFGANGQLGRAVAERLLASGWQVWAASRGGRGIPEDLAAAGAEAFDPGDKTAGQALADCGMVFDGVFDPTAYTEDDARSLAAQQRRYGALVVVSSASVYADPDGRSLDEAGQTGFPIFGGSIAEDTPTVAPGPATYSTRKVAMEHALLASGAPVSILRPCAVYGIGARHPREWWFVKRALDGRKSIPVAFGGKSLFHTSSTREVASLTELCLTKPAPRTLNAGDPQALTVSQIGAAIEQAIGMAVPVAPFDGPFQRPLLVGATPWSTERPFVLDVSRARSLGWDGGEPYEIAVREVCRWLIETARAGDWRAHFTKFAEYGFDPFNYAAEDAAAG